MRRTKIVCTIGPSTSSTSAIHALIDGGMDIARINMSHGDHETHAETIACLRRTAEELGRNLGILVDLAGPKVRVCGLNEPIVLESGQTVTIAKESSEHTSDISVTSFEWFEALTPGDPVLLDDGALELSFVDCVESMAVFEVVRGGVLTEGKGVNIPNVSVEASSVTEKDLVDLEFALGKDVEYIGLSFVLSATDVLRLKDKISGKTLIVAKIEKAKAMEGLAGIVNAADALMVARGDLGVELPPERVPAIQKNIIQQCREEGKPVVVATQMLESMINNNTPTRAEASDVANAIYDGADAVMLSAESAIGKFPIESVTMMNNIIQSVEKDSDNYNESILMQKKHDASSTDAITNAAYTISENAHAKAIVTFSVSGRTTLRMSRERSPVRVVGISPNIKTARKLQMAWGVHSCLGEDAQNTREMVANACTIVKKANLAKNDDSIVITAGVPFGNAGATNLLRIAKIIEDKNLT